MSQSDPSSSDAATDPIPRYSYYALAVLLLACVLNFLDRLILSILAQNVESGPRSHRRAAWISDRHGVRGVLRKVSTMTGSLETGIFSVLALAPIAVVLLILTAIRMPRETAAARVARAHAAGETSSPVHAQVQLGSNPA